LTERFLVTGALGCIGAWTVKRLLDEGVEVCAFDLAGEPRRLRLIMDQSQLARAKFIEGDITDLDRFEKAVVQERITHIIHLAALQVPFVRADPVAGARVNVVGTTIVLEVARRHADQVQGLVYTSSAGVYGPGSSFGDDPLQPNAQPEPPTLYGVFKHANEQTARIYWEENSLPTIGLRPYVVYGPGRDQGMSSPPTKAILAAAAKRPYNIPLAGALGMQYADDVAALFIRAARLASSVGKGAPVIDLGGYHVEMSDWVAAIESVAPESKGTITFNRDAVKNVEIPANAMGSRLGQFAWTPTVEGIRQTLGIFRSAIAGNLIDVERGLA
jgi:UDP-glucuronate 4-epimerase